MNQAATDDGAQVSARRSRSVLIQSADTGGPDGCALGCLGILLGLGVLSWLGYVLFEKPKAEAKAAYEHALQEIKNNPGNPDVRQRALALGRKYANLTSDLDEAMIMNDINVVSTAPMSQPVSMAEEIEKMARLEREGVISRGEFDALKSQLSNKPSQQVSAAVQLLRELHDLKSKGVLSQSEFNMKKWDILSGRIILR